MKARYIRQSTKAQNGNLRQLAKAHASEKLYIDVVSGSVAFDKREQGSELLKAVANGEINFVTFHAVDRCGRSTGDVLKTLEFMREHNVTVKIENLGLESMIGDKVNPVFNLVTTILAELGSLEKNTLLERQAEGIAIAKAKGTIYKGRVKGTTESDEVVLKRYDKVVKVLKQHPTLSLQKIADICNKDINKDKDTVLSPNTVRKVKKLLAKQ
jgi:DNA invertase Pin-like site-specific DNA recombinase